VEGYGEFFEDMEEFLEGLGGMDGDMDDF
jgi:hypothetical protein